MELKDFKQRNIAPGYIFFEGEAKPENGWESFKRVLKRSIKGELFVGLWIVFREMIRFDIHTVQYPAEKLEMGPRYRAIHKLLRLFESGNERCIGCGLCEKACVTQKAAIFVLPRNIALGKVGDHYVQGCDKKDEERV